MLNKKPTQNVCCVIKNNKYIYLNITICFIN